MTRIELASSVWKTEALPLSYIPAVGAVKPVRDDHSIKCWLSCSPALEVHRKVGVPCDAPTYGRLEAACRIRYRLCSGLARVRPAATPTYRRAARARARVPQGSASHGDPACRRSCSSRRRSTSAIGRDARIPVPASRRRVCCGRRSVRIWFRHFKFPRIERMVLLPTVAGEQTKSDTPQRVRVDAIDLPRSIFAATDASSFELAMRQQSRGVAQLGRALGLGPRGRRFESCRPDLHNMKRMRT